MESIKPLFSTKDVCKTKNNNIELLNKGIVTNDSQHEFYLVESYKEFAKRLTKLEINNQYTFVSFGQWSLKHVVFHIIKLIGKAEIYSTTYGLGPASARGIVSGLNSGLIKSFNFLYDNKIKSYKFESHDICVSNFPVKIASIHAKVTVLLSDKFGITVTGSANWSDSNNKIEINTISTNANLANFHKRWILSSMQVESSEPKQIYNEIKHKI
ncbi:MAG: hypothetical protein J7K53_11320 [Bacteroidales bacterium]|nr:hypothetical protein [Bacteroidales bacterium]